MATSPVTFVREVRTELGKVVWPKREQTIRLTAVVVAISIAVALFIGGLDIVLTKVTEIALKR